MAVQRVTIALSTDDVARSVKFYVEQLGFVCPLLLDGFARVRLGAADIILAQPNAHLPWQGPRFTGSIYLEVDNIDELWEGLKTRAPHRLSNRNNGVRRARVRPPGRQRLSVVLCPACCSEMIYKFTEQLQINPSPGATVVRSLSAKTPVTMLERKNGGHCQLILRQAGYYVSAIDVQPVLRPRKY